MNDNNSCGSCGKADCDGKSQQPGEQQEDFEQRQALRRRLCRISHKVLVLSGKGGVGKSTVAVNLAVGLSLDGYRVGLLDIDVHGPSIPTMLGLTGTRMQSADGEMLPVEIGDLKVMSLGLILDGRDQAVIWRGPLKMAAIRQLLVDVAWGDLDVLVVDCPPGTGDEPLSVIQLIGDADGAIVVTTPQEVALADVRRSINFCRQLELPVLGVVENMSGLVCPHCQEVIPLFKVGGGEAMATEMHVPFLGRVPLSPAVVDSGDGGHPILSRKNDDPAAQALRQIAQAVGQRLGLKATASEVVNPNV